VSKLVSALVLTTPICTHQTAFNHENHVAVSARQRALGRSISSLASQNASTFGIPAVFRRVIDYILVFMDLDCVLVDKYARK